MKNYLLAACAAIFALAGCETNDPTGKQNENGAAVENVTVSPATKQLQIDATAQLEVIIEPEGAQTAVTWVSVAPNVATVSQTGLVTALEKGTTTIIAQAGTKGATCTITVVGKLATSISVSPETLELKDGEGYKLEATVLPADADSPTIVWKSSNTDVALVDRQGNITTYSPGTSTITASIEGVEGVEDTCELTVTQIARVGDFYYSDGTYSTALKAGKTPIGVIFWLGDATAQDPTLKKDHPECTNGLVIALGGEVQDVAWQPNGYEDKAISPWVEDNTDFDPIMVYGGDPTKTRELNTIHGYNDTRALEAFNAAPENSAWKVEAIATLPAYRTSVPVPAATSGWYLPSPKELSLLCTGPVDGDIWDAGGNAHYQRINAKIEMVGGATKLATAYYQLYLSSSELSPWLVAGIYFPQGSCLALWLKTGGNVAGYPHNGNVRYVLAF